MKRRRFSWEQPWWRRPTETAAGWLFVLVLVAACIVVVLWSSALNEDNRQRCEAAGGVWIKAYRTPGQCLVGIKEIHP